jgi:environmental stress-induced protein Ves
VRLLPAAARRWVPWKNGGGMTSEVAIGPENAGLGDFGWRVSIARIEKDGPFSAFQGVERTFVVLDGGPVTLAVSGRETVLRAGSDAFRFNGGEPVAARIAEPATVLNVMTRVGAWTANLDGTGEETVLLATAPTLVGTFSLARFDAIWLTNEEVYAADHSIRIGLCSLTGKP